MVAPPQIVPKLPMRFCILALANNVRKDSGEIRKFAYATGQSEKGRKTNATAFLPKRYCI